MRNQAFVGDEIVTGLGLEYDFGDFNPFHLVFIEEFMQMLLLCFEENRENHTVEKTDEKPHPNDYKANEIEEGGIESLE